MKKPNEWISYLLIVAAAVSLIAVKINDHSTPHLPPSKTLERVTFIEPSGPSYALVSTNSAYNVEIIVIDGQTKESLQCGEVHLQDLEVPINTSNLSSHRANDQGTIFIDMDPGWYGTRFTCHGQAGIIAYPAYNFAGDIHVDEVGRATFYSGKNGFKPNSNGVLEVEMTMSCHPTGVATATSNPKEIYGTPCQ